MTQVTSSHQNPNIFDASPELKAWWLAWPFKSHFIADSVVRDDEKPEGYVDRVNPMRNPRSWLPLTHPLFLDGFDRVTQANIEGAPERELKIINRERGIVRLKHPTATIGKRTMLTHVRFALESDFVSIMPERPLSYEQLCGVVLVDSKEALPLRCVWNIGKESAIEVVVTPGATLPLRDAELAVERPSRVAKVN